MTSLILGVTGHRPHILGGYGDNINRLLLRTATIVLDDLQPSLVNIGMALGWDQAVAQVCTELNIPFDAYIPFPTQSDAWPQHAQLKWEALKSKARKVHISSNHYYTGVMQLRNSHIVHNSNQMLALWNGDKFGGTYHCLQIAKQQGLTMVNCWNLFDSFKEQQREVELQEKMRRELGLDE